MGGVAERIKTAYEAYGQGDTAPLLDLLAADVEWDASAAFAHRGVFHGHDGVLEYLSTIEDVWAEFALEPMQFMQLGSKVLVSGRIEGTIRETGEHVSTGFAHRGEMRAGKLARVEVIVNWKEAAAALRSAADGSGRHRRA